jgi:hypothetical protein
MHLSVTQNSGKDRILDKADANKSSKFENGNTSGFPFNLDATSKLDYGGRERTESQFVEEKRIFCESTLCKGSISRRSYF